MKTQFQLFSHYNKKMNQRLYQAAEKLSQTDLTQNRGAFFKSVIGTLNHLLATDIIWLKRFSQDPASNTTLTYIKQLDKPTALDSILYPCLTALRIEREKIDNIIIDWINALTDTNGSCSITYNNMAGIKFTKNYFDLINHLFLHQVHHRGQITTLLSQSRIDFGDTDLLEFIADIN